MKYKINTKELVNPSIVKTLNIDTDLVLKVKRGKSFEAFISELDNSVSQNSCKYRVLRLMFDASDGFVGTTESREKTGNAEAPRRIRDCRLSGCHIDTVKLNGVHGYRLTTLDIYRCPGSRRNLSAAEKTIVRKKTQGCCALCGDPNPTNPQYDHKIPYKECGPESEELSNFQYACEKCNLNKKQACFKCSTKECAKCYWAFPEKHKSDKKLGVEAEMHLKQLQKETEQLRKDFLYSMYLQNIDRWEQEEIR